MSNDDAIANIHKDAQARMAKSIDALRHTLVKVRTGRASTALVEHIKVNYYGSEVPLSQVASVAVSDARSLMITPWEKQIVGAVEKAILGSDLGLTPNTSGTVIRLNLPALTEERRKELVKKAHDLAEHARIGIREARREANEKLKKLGKDGKVGQDDERRAHDDIQKLHDRHIDEIAKALEHKEKDILTV